MLDEFITNPLDKKQRNQFCDFVRENVPGYELKTNIQIFADVISKKELVTLIKEKKEQKKEQNHG